MLAHSVQGNNTRTQEAEVQKWGKNLYLQIKTLLGKSHWRFIQKVFYMVPSFSRKAPTYRLKDEKDQNCGDFHRKVNESHPAPSFVKIVWALNDLDKNLTSSTNFFKKYHHNPKTAHAFFRVHSLIFLETFLWLKLFVIPRFSGACFSFVLNQRGNAWILQMLDSTWTSLFFKTTNQTAAQGYPHLFSQWIEWHERRKRSVNTLISVAIAQLTLMYKEGFSNHFCRIKSCKMCASKKVTHAMEVLFGTRDWESMKLPKLLKEHQFQKGASL